ncbi:hypothetical protein MDAP_000367 [Mitosporidium daphniae]
MIKIVKSAMEWKSLMDSSKLKPLLVDFSAEWCGPCKSLFPVLSKISETKSSSITFAKVDTDEFPDLARKYKITSLPTMKLFIDSQEKSQLVGAQSPTQIISFLDSQITQNK